MNQLIEISKEYSIDITENQCEQFKTYFELLVEWNGFMNLTSITEKNDVMIKHFLDSMMAAKYVDLSGKTLIDVGTGAGFPGLPLKILVPELNVCLLDSLNKRVKFLNEVIDRLSLSGIDAVHMRAEDGANNKLYREKFDFATSRAVANLSILSEYCLPFVKQGGKFISYKSDDCEEEINSSKNAIKILGGKINKVESFVINSLDGEVLGRSLVIIDKLSSTDKKYPRKAGVPSKSPL